MASKLQSLSVENAGDAGGQKWYTMVNRKSGATEGLGNRIWLRYAQQQMNSGQGGPKAKHIGLIYNQKILFHYISLFILQLQESINDVGLSILATFAYTKPRMTVGLRTKSLCIGNYVRDAWWLNFHLDIADRQTKHPVYLTTSKYLLSWDRMQIVPMIIHTNIR